MKKLLVLIVSAIIITGGAVFATAENSDTKKDGVDKARGKRGDKMLRMMDTDKNGMVSESEFTAHHKKTFSEIDANNDKSITTEEMKAHKKAKKAKFKEMKEKMQSQRDERFNNMDTDGDGKISKEEMEASHKAGKGKRRMHNEPMHDSDEN